MLSTIFGYYTCFEMPHQLRVTFYKLYFFNLILAQLLLNMSGTQTCAQSKSVIFDRITIDEGLSQGTVTSICQDQKGFIWFGTHDGLNRYDGYNFKIFKHNSRDINSINSNWITQIDQDKNGNLWIATDIGFNKFNNLSETFENYFVELPSRKKLLEGSRVYSILCDKYQENIIWLGTVYGTVKFDTRNKNFKLLNAGVEFTKDNYVKCLAQDNSRNIWIGTSGTGVFKYQPGKNQLIKIGLNSAGSAENKSVDYVTNIFVDKSDEVWLTTQQELLKYNQSQGNFVPVKYLHGALIPAAGITAIAADTSGFLYFGAVNNFLIYDRKKKNVKIFTNDPDDPASLPNSSVLSIYVDKSGIVWIGTNGYGINRINHKRKSFYSYPKLKGKPQVKSIRTFCEDGLGNIWIGGYKGLEKIDKRTGELFFYDEFTNSKFAGVFPSIYSLCTDRNKPKEIIWIGTEGGGVFRFNFITGIVESISKKSLKGNSVNGVYIFDIHDDGDGNLWIGTEKGLEIYSKSKREFKSFVHVDSDPGSIGPRVVNCIFEDSFGRMWIGTDHDGLNLFNGINETFKHYIVAPTDLRNQSRNNIKVIYEDHEKNLWLGTAGGGLIKFDVNKNKFENYTLEDGLPNDFIYGILGGDNYDLWLSTNLGLCRFNYKTKLIRNFTVDEGLQSNEFNSNAYFKSSSGEMFFGGINGFNSFFPGQLSVNKHIPPVAITNFYLFNEIVPISIPINGDIVLTKSIIQTDTIVLSHSNNIFTFEFAALDFTSPKLNKYMYKLEGFNEDWINSGKSRLANYTNIDPGTYVFRVIGSNNDDIWNETGIAIVVIIDPPYWSTWWFKLLGIVVFGVLLYGLYEFRLIAEKKRSELLEKEVEQRTEELRIANDMLRKDAMMLEETSASKDKLFSIISHDLKNPFQSLLGYTEWLMKDYSNFAEDEKRKIIGNIRESSVNIYNLLVRLLEWSRLQTSSTIFEPVKIDLKNFVDSIIKVLRVSLEKKQISVVNEIDYNTFIHADENMLNSILQNLLSNAIKFSYENSIIIVSSIANEEFVAVSVSDSGVGISKEVVQKLFNTGTIHSTKGTADEQGTGFGLLLCKELVEKNGGTIWAESEAGTGSSFKFTIPKSNHRQ